MSSQSVTVFTSRFLAAVSQRRSFPFLCVSERSPASATSLSSSSERLNTNGYLTAISNLSCLYHLGTDRTENTVRMLLFMVSCIITAVV
jgi:hypothetical protein